MWQFANMMQFGKEFTLLVDLALFVVDDGRLHHLSETIRSDKSVAWTNILELLFDDEAKDFARSASEAGIPAPDEENIGYEVDGPDGQVIATVEIAWPDRKIGFLTTEQLSDREHLEQNGWTIIDMLTIDESAQLFSD